MAEHEAVPLPRHRAQPEQVTDHDGVGARVGHHEDPPVGLAIVQTGSSPGRAPCPARPGTAAAPRRMRATKSRTDSPPGRPSQRTCDGVPGRRRRPPRPSPTASPARSGCGSPPASRRPALAARGGRGGAPRSGGPGQRRDVDLVEVLVGQALGHAGGLLVASLGQRRVVDVEAVPDPLGLTVANEDDLHGGDCRGASPRGPIRRRGRSEEMGGGGEEGRDAVPRRGDPRTGAEGPGATCASSGCSSTGRPISGARTVRSMARRARLTDGRIPCTCTTAWLVLVRVASSGRTH